jgi:hypothetical protein
MLPFNNNITNQNYSDLYSAPPYYGTHAYYLPEEAMAMMNSYHDNENNLFPFSPNFADNFEPFPADNFVKVE